MQANQQIVFIDSQVADYQLLANGVLPGIEVVILKSDRDGISQITQILSQRNNYASIHIVSHGSPGCLYLGNTQLSLDTLIQYKSALQTWFSYPPLLRGGSALGGFPDLKRLPWVRGDLLIYGCNVAAGDAGEEFINKLHDITGASIAASTTPIGNAAKGGNWELDVSTASDKNKIVFNRNIRQKYAGIFGSYQNNNAETIKTASTITKQFAVTENVTITDVSLDLFTQHTWRGNTQTILTSPSGTSVTLVARDQGDNWDNFEITLEDGSTNPINDGDDDGTNGVVDRTVAPSNPFSAFDGESALGTWTLEITNFDDPSIIAPTTRDLTFTSSELNITGTPITTISGTVFNDYDNDGTQEVGNLPSELGYAGIIVTAYFSDGSTETDTTVSDGNYSITNTNNLPARVEFTGLPNNYYGSSLANADANTVSSVFFNDGTNQTANFGIFEPNVSELPGIEIGNRIWLDTNFDGIQDPGETGTDLTGITVSLYGMSDLNNPVKVGETTTDAAGEYNFNDSNVTLNSASGIEPNNSYEIRLDNAADFTTGGVLDGYKLTSSSQGSNDEIDSDAVDNSEPTISLTTGDYGANDTSQDFGFTETGELFSLGNRVWEDTDNDGTINGVESGIDDVTVNLYVDGDNDNVPDGASIASTTTANGGYYRFDDLVAGNYIVEVDADNFETSSALEGFVSSGTDETEPDDDVDINDNGIGIVPDATNGIRSNAVTLGPGFSEPIGETDVDPTFPTETVVTRVESVGGTVDTITYDGVSAALANNGSDYRFTGDGAYPSRFEVDATGYGTSLVAFCIEFAEFVATGNFNPANASGAAPYFNSSYQDPNDITNFFGVDPNADDYGIITQDELNLISTVWANVEDDVLTDLDAVQALQVLIWELQSDQTFDLTNGNFILDASAGATTAIQTNTQEVIDTVGTWVTNANDGTWKGSVDLAILTIEDQQDLIVNLDLDVGANDNQSNLTVDFGFGGPERDFGDAPDAADGTNTGDYKTRLADDGPSHIIDNNLLIGTSIDFEDGISENAAADADGADEDGFSNPLPSISTDNTTGYSLNGITVKNETTETAKLIGWIDFDRDGVFSSDEATSATVNPSDTISNLNWSSIPTDITDGTTYARFRLSTDDRLTTDYSDGALNDGEVEDYQISLDGVDYGDAPDIAANTGTGNYQTTQNDSGASHLLGSGLTIGADVDGDNGTLQNLAATADTDDGVTFTETLNPSSSSFNVSVDVNLPTTTLSVSDDFSSGFSGGSGDWSVISWTENDFTSGIGETSGRVRVSNGIFELRGTKNNRDLSRTFDFSNATGDATLTFNYSQENIDIDNGFLIQVSNGTDTETVFTVDNSTANSAAAGESASVTIDRNLLTPNTTIKIVGNNNDINDNSERVYIDNINISAPGVNPAILAGWIDFDANGEFSADEAVSTTVNTSGTQTLTWDNNDASADNNIPGDIITGTTYARFRLSTDSALDTIEDSDSINQLSDGEVEDYQILIEGGTDYGDAPDGYGTLAASGGANHAIVSGLSLGSATDAESDGQPSVDADGDNLNLADDEEGVTFNNTLINTDTEYSVSVDVVNTTGSDALVTGWVDFDRSGTFDDSEKVSTIFSDSGTQELTWDSLAGLTSGDTYARFRLTNDLAANTTNIFTENFDSYTAFDEATTGWDINPNSDDSATTANTGAWEIGDSNLVTRDSGTYNVELDAFSANNALITGLASTSTSTSANHDIDGDTTINSPTFTLSNDSGLYNLSFRYFITSNGDTSDEFSVKLFRSNGDELETLFAQELSSSQLTPTSWSEFNDYFNLDEYQGETVYLQFYGVDGGNVDVVELGVDDVNLDFIGADPTGASNTGEVEDYKISIEAAKDYGDAPDDGINGNYFTSITNSGTSAASHVIVDGLKIGNAIDDEDGSLQNDTATADNLDGTDDEDGVTSFNTLQTDAETYSVTLNVTNTTTSAAKLVGWIDFDGNGVFDADEAVETSVNINDTSATLTWNDSNIPADIVGGDTFARFRLSTDTDLTTNLAFGALDSGEVEDYQLTITEVKDYGDAPDTTTGTGAGDYQTTTTNSGTDAPSHVIVDGLSLGTDVDSDDGTQANSDATADDVDVVTNDEDGVTFTGGTAFNSDDGSYSVDVDIVNDNNQDVTVVGWIDFDQSGTFDADEAVSTSGTLSGSQTLTWSSFPEDIESGNTFARFRISTDDNLTTSFSTGELSDGEVEDYQVTINGVDYGDAPDADDNLGTGNYDTTADDNGKTATTDGGGAAHNIVDNLYLGASVDADTGTAQNLGANADDNRGADDEDGVASFNTLSINDSNSTYTVTVNVNDTTGAGTNANLIGWIDFNGNGEFETTEASGVISGADINGNQILTWTTPAEADITAGTTYARIRLSDSTLTDANSTGLIGNGEVEDYQIVIEGGTDFGDATTGSDNYATTTTSHGVIDGMSIGDAVDSESSVVPNTSASTDDDSGIDDEDGVTFVDTKMIGQEDSDNEYSVEVVVNSSATGDTTLVGWIDFDRDGTFDTDEGYSLSTDPAKSSDGTSILNTDGATANTITWTGINAQTSGVTPGDTYARFRLSSDADLTTSFATGELNSGEIEDYVLKIKNEVTGTGAGDLINASSSDPTTANDDLIIGGAGQDTLTGGDGDDCFHFNRTSDGIDIITDFKDNGDSDKIDISDLFATGGELEGVSNPFGTYVVVLPADTASNGTMIQVDFDGSGDSIAKSVVFLEGYDNTVTPITAEDFVF